MAGIITKMDRFDREASKEGRAINKARSFGVARPDTLAVARRGVLRGAMGAAQRKGMLKV